MERKERLENVKSWRECGGEDAVGVRTVKAAGKKRGKAFSREFLDGRWRLHWLPHQVVLMLLLIW